MNQRKHKKILRNLQIVFKFNSPSTLNQLNLRSHRNTIFQGGYFGTLNQT